jgi:hypothetical protein
LEKESINLSFRECNITLHPRKTSKTTQEIYEYTTERLLSDAYRIDEHINLRDVITTLQYIKDQYVKNGNLHLILNRCIEDLQLFWYDYQYEWRNMAENLRDAAIIK